MERELWKALYSLMQKLDKQWGDWFYSNSDVLAAYFWAVLHDRPISWAANPHEWPADLRPRCLPSQSTLSRRLRQPKTVEFLTSVEQHLLALVVTACWVHSIDGKALAVSAVSKDPDAGFGRGAGANQKGYKLHAVWGTGPMPVAWGLAPMNVSEKTMARHLIATLGGTGYLLGDQQYDANDLYDAAARQDLQLIAKKRTIVAKAAWGIGDKAPADYEASPCFRHPLDARCTDNGGRSSRASAH
jgi:hypothetical protein